MLEVGKIVRLQGIKGELKILPFADEKILKKSKEFFINGQPTKIEKVSFRPNGAYVKFIGIDDTITAKTFVDKLIFVPKEKALECLDKNEFLVSDLLGAEIVVDGKKTGFVDDIDNFGSKDVYFVKANVGKNFSFPAVDGIFEEVDSINKKIVLNGKLFDEVVTYED